MIIEWMNENVPTIIGTAVVAYIFIAVIVTRIKDHREGKGSCGCCANRDFCHNKPKDGECCDFDRQKSSVDASVERAKDVDVPYEY